MKKKKEKISDSKLFLRIFLIVTGVFLIALAIFIVVTEVSKELQSSTEITIPRISGIYTPLDGSNYTVVVLDNSNKYHNQLASEIRVAFQQINQLNLQEVNK